MATAERGPGSILDRFLNHGSHIFTAAFVLRAALLIYGIFQDSFSPVRYTDVDYLVFTDAARFVKNGIVSSSSAEPASLASLTSPYDRATYRYTPLLAWALLPTAFAVPESRLLSLALFSSGKVLFAAADLVVGYLIARILERRLSLAGHAGGDATPPGRRSPRARAHLMASLWLLNPMVATISTRGNAESLLAILVTGTLACVLSRRFALGGLLMGLSVHFKIYPVIYIPAILLWAVMSAGQYQPRPGWPSRLLNVASSALLSSEAWSFLTASALTFAAATGAMYQIYGDEFLEHTYFYHLVRIDHRHNFSVYNTALHLSHVAGADGPGAGFWWAKVESLAFLPQLLVSVVAIPAALLLGVEAKGQQIMGSPGTGKPKRAPTRPLILPAVMFLQTFAFVGFNKVCTSQYFLWYINLLPFVIGELSSRPDSSTSCEEEKEEEKKKDEAGCSHGHGHQHNSIPSWALATAGWVLGQAIWLGSAYQLEFLGVSTFAPQLWLASMLFFGVNVFILCWAIQLLGS